MQAYGSLFGGNRRALNDKRLAAVVDAHAGKCAGQILLRWAVQKGFQVIPKSVKQDRIQDNMNLFDFQLSDSELASLSDWTSKDLDEYWNPLADAPVDSIGLNRGNHRELMEIWIFHFLGHFN